MLIILNGLIKQIQQNPLITILKGPKESVPYIRTSLYRHVNKTSFKKKKNLFINKYISCENYD